MLSLMCLILGTITLALFRPAPVWARLVVFLVLTTGVFGFGWAVMKQSGPQPSPPTTLLVPVVRVTEVPPAGEGPTSRGAIGGTVEGLQDPQQYKIVVYAFTDNKWYVQPVADQPLTDITPDGTWSNWTHLGSAYAALVVRLPYTPPPMPEALPATGGAVLAVARKDARGSR